MNALALARLVRLPNVPTAAADILAGYWLARAARGAATEPAKVLILTLASGCLYAAGMVFNDWFDVEVDRRERLFRPLPSGQIRVTWALRLAMSLLAAGAFLPFVVSVQAGVLASILALAIVSYNGWLKANVALGCAGMGLCRALNFLLGAVGGLSVVGAGALVHRSFGNTDWDFAWIAATNGIYVAAVTWIARHEAGVSQRRSLLLATGLLLLAVALHHVAVFNIAGRAAEMPGAAPSNRSSGQVPIPCQATTALLLGWLGYWCVAAIRSPTPVVVQRAVKWSILSLVLLNAQCALAVNLPWHAAAIAALLAPCVGLGRWVYST